MNSEYPRAAGRDIVAVKSDGTKAGFTAGAGNSLGVFTYYVPVASQRGSLESLHFHWDATFVGVITFESCNFPEFATVQNDVADVSLVDANAGATLGNWVQENPSSAYIAFASATGASAASATITVTGGTANGCTIHIGNIGTARLRAKIACSTAGVVRVASWGKVT